MKVVIVEDEIAATEHLIDILGEIDSKIEVLVTLDTVKKSIDYFQQPTEAQLVFMDIHLADGISFEIFEKVNISIPVIFTTAYDEYALKAFKVNSLDYLLKPVDDEELKSALSQYHKNSSSILGSSELNAIRQLVEGPSKKYRSTFLVNHRDGMVPIKTDDIAYFFIDNGVVYAYTETNQKYVIEKKLDDVELELNPQKFKRANRQFIVNRDALVNIKFYFNGKLILNTQPPSAERIVVSKARATEFKNWVDN